MAPLGGPDGKHNPDRAGYRHGTEAGSVTPGGLAHPGDRPPVRAAAGSGELHLPSYDLYSSAEILGQLALEKGQSTCTGTRMYVKPVLRGPGWLLKRHNPAAWRVNGSSSPASEKPGITP